MTMALAGAVFLDRDGVIVRNRPDYVRTPDDLELLPGAVDAIQRLCAAGHRVMVATNQSVVGRGLVTERSLLAIHRRLCEMVAGEAGGIERIYVCMHHPDAGCACRKPRPGLLLAARRDTGVSLAESVLIGDMPSDVEAAHAAGCASLLIGDVTRGADAADLAGAVDLLLASAAA